MEDRPSAGGGSWLLVCFSLLVTSSVAPLVTRQASFQNSPKPRHSHCHSSQEGVATSMWCYHASATTCSEFKSYELFYQPQALQVGNSSELGLYFGNDDVRISDRCFDWINPQGIWFSSVLGALTYPVKQYPAVKISGGFTVKGGKSAPAEIDYLLVHSQNGTNQHYKVLETGTFIVIKGQIADGKSTVGPVAVSSFVDGHIGLWLRHHPSRGSPDTLSICDELNYEFLVGF